MARGDDEKPNQDAENTLRRRGERTLARAGDEQPHGKSRRRTPPNVLAHDAQMRMLEDQRQAEQPAAHRGLPVAQKVDPRAVPAEVTRWFVPLGNTYYHPEGVYAFTDKGDRLTTRSENAEVIDAFVTIARARGWQDVTVSGTDRFKQDAWLAARTVGLNVRGYEPSELDQRRLVKAVQRQSREGQDDDPSDRAPRKPRARAARGYGAPADRRPEASRGSTPDSTIRGELVDFGPAHYQHLPHKSPSYFVTVATERGERTIWGVDLERAMREALSNPQRGDQVVLRRDSQKSVTIRSSELDEKGGVVRAGPFAAERNQWSIEKRQFLRDRSALASLVRDAKVDHHTATTQRPELVGTYLTLAAAEMHAQKLDPEDRRMYMEYTRNRLADDIARGAPLDPVRVREPTRARGTGRGAVADREHPPHAR
jgi:hypothetical protein